MAIDTGTPKSTRVAVGQICQIPQPVWKSALNVQSSFNIKLPYPPRNCQLVPCAETVVKGVSPSANALPSLNQFPSSRYSDFGELVQAPHRIGHPPQVPAHLVTATIVKDNGGEVPGVRRDRAAHQRKWLHGDELSQSLRAPAELLAARNRLNRSFLSFFRFE